MRNPLSKADQSRLAGRVALTVTLLDNLVTQKQIEAGWRQRLAPFEGERSLTLSVGHVNSVLCRVTGRDAVPSLQLMRIECMPDQVFEELRGLALAGYPNEVDYLRLLWIDVAEQDENVIAGEHRGKHAPAAA